MSRSLDALKQAVQVGTITSLTSIFENIASMRIAKIKDKVTRSQMFFDELWGIYTSLRIDPNEHFVNAGGVKRDKPNVILALTGEGGLSGDIDSRIVRKVMEAYDPETTELIVIGAHGATQLVQRGANIKRYFRLPDVDQAIDVSPIVSELIGYKMATVYFQRYVSLSVQEVAMIELVSRVKTLGADSTGIGVISPRDYLFEPNVEEIVHYLEAVMMEIALSQVILESRLAQYASRFTAMSAANQRAKQMETGMFNIYRRAKRGEADSRTKDIINSMNALGEG
jgi:F-type H+-transporting ATPase subunit gamma